MSQLNHSKFSLAEMTSNENGKTSASGTMGSLLVLIGGLSFLLAVIFFVAGRADVEPILIQSIALCYAGAALLGFRKNREGQREVYPEDLDDVPEEPQE